MNILHLTQTPLYSMTLSISSYLFNCHFHLLGIISQNKWANNNVHFYKKKKNEIWVKTWMIFSSEIMYKQKGHLTGNQKMLYIRVWI